MIVTGEKKGHRYGSFRVISAIFIILLMVISGRESRAREITDMAGRTVSIGQVNRVWSAYPPVTYLMYAVDPSLLIGWTGPLSEASKKYIRNPYQDMPVVGGWFGQRTPNFESLAAAKPDLALVWDQSLSIMPTMAEKLQGMQIPTVAIRLFRLADYPKALYFLGDVLNRKERAQELAVYIEQTINEMKAFSDNIPVNKKVSVYYAIGPDGLTNDCDHMPFLEEAIELAGGRSVHKCVQAEQAAGQKIDLERLLLYDPDFIITQEDLFFSKVFTDTKYSQLRAVKEHRVYMIPKTPFNWLNYPPSFMRALGIRWLAHTIHPNLYKGNLEKETIKFFKLFLGVDIDEGEAKKILQQEKH